MPRKSAAPTIDSEAIQEEVKQTAQTYSAEYVVDPNKTTSIVCGNRVVYIGKGIKRVAVEMRGDGA